MSDDELRALAKAATPGLVERLSAVAETAEVPTGHNPPSRHLCAEAADALATLEAEVDRLKDDIDLMADAQRAHDARMASDAAELKAANATLEAENKRLRDALAAVQSIAAENAEQASRAFKGFNSLNAASYMHGRAQGTSQQIDAIARAALEQP